MAKIVQDVMKKKDGYILDTTYPIYFYKEMQPFWLKTVFGILGFKTSAIEQSFSYLELGCAQGINLIIAAMQNPHAQFIGVDFNAEHIAHAKALVQHLRLNNIKFIESDFATFLETNQLSYDFIVNHGTFSWVSHLQQEKILEIAAKFLKKQGIFYLHYMCYPGSTELQPIQKLLNLVDQSTGQSSLKGLQEGKKLFSQLYDAGAFIHQSKIQSIVNTLNQKNEYLAHEFLTNHWQPFYSVDVHQRVFDSSQMSYIGSANPSHNIDSISLPSKLQNIIAEIQEPALKEYLKDLARNSKQRVDVFQKNPINLQSKEHLDTLKSLEFTSGRAFVPNQKIVFQTAVGDIQAPEQIIASLLQRLSQKNMIAADFMQLEPFENNILFLIETLCLLMEAGYIHPVMHKGSDVDPDLVEKFNLYMKNAELGLQLSSTGIVLV